jgi:hypothetical protein
MQSYKSPAKNKLIQFRADDLLLKRLIRASLALQTPVGVLARQWVAERLNAEELKYLEMSLYKVDS